MSKAQTTRGRARSGDEVVYARLRAQRLAPPASARVAEVVAWLGAVQAQDYRGGLWGIGQRVAGAREADVEAALAERTIVRTWPMRGTLHIVAADDVRWMLRMLAPRVIARAAGRHRQLRLDADTFARSRTVLERALAGRQLTRPEAYAELERAGISTEGQRGIHILGELAMEGVLCMGAHRGKQATFARLDEWIPSSRELAGDEALAELAARYFTSHGPATVHDFAWWTGLTIGEARRAVEAAGERVAPSADGACFAARSEPQAPPAGTLAHLLPAWDEYCVAYKDRSAFLDPADAARAKQGIMSPVIAIDGRIAGTWKRAARKGRVVVQAALFARPGREARRVLDEAAARYGEFVGVPAVLEA